MALQHDVGARVLAGRYELGPLIGYGGMAEVYRATDQRLDRQVAVKVLRPALAAHEESRRRFEAEARMAARVEHLNVVAVYDSGEDDNVPFIVTECLSGRTLSDEIAEGALSTERLAAVLREVLGALDAAHTAGVIHRDVKPGNVLLVDDGHVKVSDFGIAKALELPDQTLTRELLATPGYLAPERAAGEAASPRSDLYSVGVMAYEALAGERPFRGDNPIAILTSIRDGAATPLAQLRPDVPAPLVAVIKKAMAPEPDQRFQSAPAMLNALVHALSQAHDPEATIAVAPDPPTLVLEAPPAHRNPAQPPHHERVRSRKRLVPALVATVVGLVVLLGLLLAVGMSSGGDPTLPTTTVPSTQVQPARGQLPASLEQSLRQLEQSVAR